MPSAAALRAALTASAVTGFSVSTTISTTDTSGVGTLIAKPFNLPFNWGNTKATAFAAPVVVGTMFKAPALALLGSLWPASKILWSPVYEWTVVIKPLTIPNSLSKTLATGAKQFVVQDAIEMMLWSLGSYSFSLTPKTIVLSSFLAGAEMITFLAPASKWAFAFVASVKKPVDSTTTSTFNSFQGSCAGSFSE